MSRTISVLMPAYNCSQYIGEAIESILNQTYDDFELIVLDDCSTDDTVEIVKGFTDSRIIYHCNEKNLGLANNLNAGLKIAKGKYIARMDGDDISLPERFQTQIDFLESHPDIDLCSCGLKMFGHEQTVWVRESDPEAVKITMLFYSPVLHATSVWRRQSFEKHDLYYNQHAFPAEDYDLWSRAIFHCKLSNIPEVLYLYRIHGAQVTKTDDRVAQKDKEIKLSYIRKSLPSLPIEIAYTFIDIYGSTDGQFNYESILKSKKIYQAFLSANQSDCFFRQELLQRRLRIHYQSIVFRYCKTKSFSCNQLNLLFQLRPAQIIKLFLKR